MKNRIDVVDDRADLVIVEDIFPGRHRGIPDTFTNPLGQNIAIDMAHECRIGQVARLRFEETADPVFPGTVGGMTKSAVVLPQLTALDSAVRQSRNFRDDVVLGIDAGRADRIDFTERKIVARVGNRLLAPDDAFIVHDCAVMAGYAAGQEQLLAAGLLRVQLFPGGI